MEERQGTVLDDGVLRLEFTVTAADSDGAMHEMHARWVPQSPFPPPHLHPNQDERFEVLQGELLFVVGGRERRVAAGEAIDIPRGTVHQARNEATSPAVAIWQTRPALRTGEFFQAIADARTQDDLTSLLEVLTEFTDVFALPGQPGD